MTTLTLKLPESLDAQLTEVAERRRASKTALLLEALREYLARQADEPTSATAAQQEPELTREYFEQYLKEHGVPAPESLPQRLRSTSAAPRGPPDLSTNKKYMEGFGES